MKRLVLLTTLLLTLLSGLTMMTQWQPTQAKVLESSVTIPRHNITMQAVANIQVKPNTPPTATVIISPTNPLDNDNLTLNYHYFDADGDAEELAKLQRFWYLNGQLQPAYTSITVPFQATAPQDTWCATVRVHDGIEYGPVAPSACATIGTGQNHAPQVLSATVITQRYLTNTVLQVTGIYSDVDLPCPYCGKKVETLPLRTVAEFQWFRDGVLQPEFNNQTVITRSITVTGEVWHVTLQVSDGIDTSSVTIARVNLLPVVTHTPPKAENLRIIPIDPVTGRTHDGDPMDGDHLRVVYDFVDAEGDVEQGSLIYWYNPLTRVTKYDGQTTIPASETQVNQVWFVQVTPCDGLDCGRAVDSDSVYIRPNAMVQANPGAVIIVGSRYRKGDSLQSNVHHVTNEVYQVFRANGYSATQIYYMATDLTLDADNDGISDVITMPTKINLEYAITQWAKDKVNPNSPLTLYFVGYGDTDKFHLDRVNGQELVPNDLHEWLNQLEAAVPGLKVNVIIDTCEAGSFISTPGTVSKPGRVIMASTSDVGLAYASQSGGVIFSDTFLQTLIPENNLNNSFQNAKTVAVQYHGDQQAWLDGNGNGVPNEAADETEASQRILFSMPENNDDLYEPDNECKNAREISTDGITQTRRFISYVPRDIDWVKFQAISGRVYTMTAIGIGTESEPRFDLWLDCDAPPTESFRASKYMVVFQASKNGFVYLEISNSKSLYNPSLTVYQLVVEERASTGITPTPTPTRTPTPTPTPTSPPILTPTVTPSSGIDSYETDDTCPEAKPIDTNGTIQGHTFHVQDDHDWVKMSLTAGTTYQIEARVPSDSIANVVMQLFEECNGSSTHYDSFGPNRNVRFKAPDTGDYFIKFMDIESNGFGGVFWGTKASYQVSVRALSLNPQPGAVVLVAGKRDVVDPLQENIYQAANGVYKLFSKQGYPADRIFYMADILSLNPDNNPTTQDVDALASRERLEYALTRWPLENNLGLGPDRALTLYMLDHGDEDKFYVNGRGETVSPNDLNGWLTTLEAAIPGVRVNVIIDACLSGSFILPPQSISKPGRVVIASTTNANNAYISSDTTSMGFSQVFIQALGNQQSVYHSFQTAKDSANFWHPDQVAWLDDNGDGFAGPTDGLVAQQRGFAFAGSFATQAEPPYIATVTGPSQIVNQRGEIKALVRSEPYSKLTVWAMVYEPSYTPPPPSGQLVADLNLPKIGLDLVPNSDGLYQGVFTGFNADGNYRMVIYATDENGLVSQPKVLMVPVGGKKTYLPVIVK